MAAISRVVNRASPVFRPLLLPALLIVLALTAYNARISREMVDFEVCRTAGRRAVASEPLYREGDGPHTFKSLPAFAVAMTPVVFLGQDASRVGWYGLSCACLVLLLRWSVLALPARRWTERSLVVVAIALLARFYAHELVLGQSNLLLGVVLLAGLGALQLEAPRVAAMAFAAAVFIKPHALILLPWLIASYGMATGAVAVAGIVAGLLVPAILYGWAGNLGQLSSWWHLVTSATAPNLPGANTVALTSMWATWIGPGPIASGLSAVSVVLLVAVAATMWRQRARVAEPDYVEFAFLLLIIPLVSPQGWGYVLPLGTPAVVCVIDRWRELHTPWRLVSGLALAVMGLSMLALTGQAAYAQSMAWSAVSVSSVVIAATLAQIRLRALA